MELAHAGLCNISNRQRVLLAARRIVSIDPFCAQIRPLIYKRQRHCTTILRSDNQFIHHSASQHGLRTLDLMRLLVSLILAQNHFSASVFTSSLSRNSVLSLARRKYEIEARSTPSTRPWTRRDDSSPSPSADSRPAPHLRHGAEAQTNEHAFAE